MASGAFASEADISGESGLGVELYNIFETRCVVFTSLTGALMLFEMMDDFYHCPRKIQAWRFSLPSTRTSTKILGNLWANSCPQFELPTIPSPQHLQFLRFNYFNSGQIARKSGQVGLSSPLLNPGRT